MYFNRDTELGAAVRDLSSGHYVVLCTTTASELLARNRAIEAAKAKNEYGAHFDTTDIVIYHRSVQTLYGDWQEEPIEKDNKVCAYEEIMAKFSAKSKELDELRKDYAAKCRECDDLAHRVADMSTHPDSESMT